MYLLLYWVTFKYFHLLLINTCSPNLLVASDQDCPPSSPSSRRNFTTEQHTIITNPIIRHSLHLLLASAHLPSGLPPGRRDPLHRVAELAESRGGRVGTRQERGVFAAAVLRCGESTAGNQRT